MKLTLFASNNLCGCIFIHFFAGIFLLYVTSVNATENPIVYADFQQQPVGAYSTAMLAADFKKVKPWNNGLDQHRASIVAEDKNKFLRIKYTGKVFGPNLGGVQFQVPFEKNYNELYFSYRVRFAKDFTFMKGGKLPGLIGGTGPTGCVSDKNGFSARNMWRTSGAIVQYLYAPLKKSVCGDDYSYIQNSAKKIFTPGKWQTIQHHLVMNTPGKNNGIIQAWVDGVLVLDIHDFIFREAGATFAINGLYFSTFFGGADSSWAPQSDQIADFDDLIVAEKYIAPALN